MARSFEVATALTAEGEDEERALTAEGKDEKEAPTAEGKEEKVPPTEVGEEVFLNLTPQSPPVAIPDDPIVHDDAEAPEQQLLEQEDEDIVDVAVDNVPVELGVDEDIFPDDVPFPVPAELRNQGPFINDLNIRLSTTYASILLVHEQVLRRAAFLVRDRYSYGRDTKAIKASVSGLFKEADDYIHQIKLCDGEAFSYPPAVADLWKKY